MELQCNSYHVLIPEVQSESGHYHFWVMFRVLDEASFTVLKSHLTIEEVAFLACKRSIFRRNSIILHIGQNQRQSKKISTSVFKVQITKGIEIVIVPREEGENYETCFHELGINKFMYEKNPPGTKKLSGTFGGIWKLDIRHVFLPATNLIDWTYCWIVLAVKFPNNVCAISFISDYTSASLEEVALILSKLYKACGPQVELRKEPEKISNVLYTINVSNDMKIYVGKRYCNEYVSNNVIYLKKFILNRSQK
jgi:hypothetical protein